MLYSAFIALLAIGSPTGDFTRYPALTPHGADHFVEAITDRGLIAEIIVSCPVGAGIISYDKVERVYCTPVDGCFDSLVVARGLTCGAY